jgi:tRNA1(Val) A37 N6-methylase TrmN6
MSTGHATFLPSRQKTRGLYARFERERAALLAALGEAGEQGERERYASLVLRNLLFISLLQEKGLLGTQEGGTCAGERDYLLRRLQMVRQKYGRGHFQHFYSVLLSSLAGHAEGEQQDALPLVELLGEVPVLPVALDESALLLAGENAFSIPDEAFERLLRFLQKLNWRLEEGSSPGGNEIHPDMIGTLFEKHGRQKQNGAYYTQKDVTAYISKNSLIPRLFESVTRSFPELFCPGEQAQVLLQADPERYLYPSLKHGCELPLPAEIEAGVNNVELRAAWEKPASGLYALPLETWREVVARRQRCAQLKHFLSSGALTSIDDFVTYNLHICQFVQDLILSTRRVELLVAFYGSLKELTVLDPTCGSGAFLLAALAVLEPLYAVCLTRLQEMVAEHQQQPGQSTTEREQDIWRDGTALVERAACFANRGLFLARTIIENNLYGLDIMREATATCKLRLFLALLARLETAAELQSLADLRFNIQTGNALVGFVTLSEVFAGREADTAKALSVQATPDQASDWVQEIEQRVLDLQQLQSVADSQIEQQRVNLEHGKDWRTSLDSSLACLYGLDAEHSSGEQFAYWQTTFQPFHWLIEWSDILSHGGFDIIIGNPPYISYSRIKEIYQVRALRTLTCGNLCAYVLERAMTVLSPRGRCGMVVPVSTIASESYSSLCQLLLEKQIWISSYSNRPARLFAGVEQRVAILLIRNVDARAVWTSAYQHWYEPEREHLFTTLSYTAASIWEPAGTPVKSGSEMAEAIFSRLVQRHGFPLLDCRQANAAVWVHNGPTYWVRALPFQPNAGQRSSRSEHYCRLPVENQETAFVLAAILSSSTFYFFYKLISNCRDLGQKELRYFPLGELRPASRARLALLGRSLAQYLKESAARRTRHYHGGGQGYESHYEEYYPARARDVLDQIDGVLAEHYGFTAEELDFLLHYESKYRHPRNML